MSSTFHRAAKAGSRKIDKLLYLTWVFLRLPFKILQITFLIISSILENLASLKTIKRGRPRTLFNLICLNLKAFNFIARTVGNFIGRSCSQLDKSANARRYLALSLVLLLCLIYYRPLYFSMRSWKSYEKGIASYYSYEFYFRRTKSGDIFMPFFYTAAHNSLPMGTYVLVKNIDNGRKVVVKINDRGPFKKGRIIDLSPIAAHALGIMKDGLAPVEIYMGK